ncbi:MAG: hypothetical protein PHZ09_04720 [Eubacteriales bacterium]|jgi:hypothetical protein|nr:hypothetical protein [Eubacteriales bacterium]
MKHIILSRYPLGNPHRVWRQDNFILSTFSARAENMRDTLENCADAGFNLLEMGWASHEQAEEALRLCEELGVDLLYQDFSLYGGMQERNMERISGQAELKSVIDHVRPYKRCIGYYVWDEPYEPDQIRESRRLVDIFQREDPGRLPFTVAIPSYNNLYRWDNGEFASYLTRYVNEIDPPVLSLDYYPIGLGNFNDDDQLDNSLMWCDLGLMRLLGRQYSMPVWFYYQAVNLHRHPHFEFPMVRVSMYAAALYGAKALQQYTAVGSVIDKKGQKDRFFDEQKQIHGEFKKLGNTLMALESRHVFHSADLLPGCAYMEGLADDIAQSGVLTGQLEERVSVGELADAAGNLYLLPLNRDYTKDRSITLRFRGPTRVYEVDRGTGRQLVLSECADSLSLPLSMGDGRLLRVQDAAQEAFTVEYRLEK